MGHSLRLITYPFRLLFAAIVAVLLFGCALMVGIFGYAVKPKKEQEPPPLTQEAANDPDLQHDDEIRRWMDDLSPADRLKVAQIWFDRQASEVGPVQGESIYEYSRKKHEQRMTTAMQN